MGGKTSKASAQPTTPDAAAAAAAVAALPPPLPVLDLGVHFRRDHVKVLPHLILGCSEWAQMLREAEDAARLERRQRQQEQLEAEANGEDGGRTDEERFRRETRRAEKKKAGGGSGGADGDDDEWAEEEAAARQRHQRVQRLAVAQERRVRFLSKHLRDELCERWTLVFASSINGSSFLRFQHYLVNSGDTLVLIRTTGGAVFGGRCENFSKPAHPDFSPGTQGMQFVFHLNPAGGEEGKGNTEDTITGESTGETGASGSDAQSSFPQSWKLWRPTGYNEHYQFLNSDTESFYNGVAMGGVQGFFTWCIDADFEHGHCRGNPGSTFGNPQLHLDGVAGAEPDDDGAFLVDHVEVWSMKEVEMDEYDLERERERRGMTKGAGSVLRSEDNADKVIKGYMFDFAAAHLGAGGTAEQNVGEDGEILLIQ